MVTIIEIPAGRYTVDPTAAPGGPALIGDATDLTLEIQALRET